MTSEMKAYLPLLIQEFLQMHNTALTISKTANPNCECLVITNMKSNKVCLLGSLKDPKTGENKIGASMIDLQKWQWAHCEGFTADEILIKLRDHVFEIVSPGDLPTLLA
tara:strand:+ start:813 stop:1139 length:327 start_codon:yes stop_codon:yes gene_type:complete